MLGTLGVLALHPASVFFLAALVAARAGARLPRLGPALLVLAPVAGTALLAAHEPGTTWRVSLQGLELMPLRVDRLSLFFAYVCHLGAFLAGIYALKARNATERVAALLYAGASVAAVLAGDLLTLFFAWEAMTLASAFVVFARRTPQAVAAGMRYLLVQVASGLLLLGGALLAYRELGSLAFDAFRLGPPWAWMLLLAFGIKCGFPLLHTWIVDAYPQATPTGTVFLSVFTTKVAAYALARGFAGTELLVFVGVVMTLFPIFYAVIENDLRRVLGYSMINQLGFIVVGIGIGTDLALAGAAMHALNEVLFKGLLFMAMGAVLARAGTAEASELGGLHKTMPHTTALCVVGALAISAFPLFNAFVSKGMILAGVLQQGHTGIWYALLFASAGVFHHAGIKVPFFAFFAHDSGLRPREAGLEMRLAMALAAAGCVLIGVRPEPVLALLPWPVEFAAYAYPHVVLQLQLLAFSALAFATMKLSGVYPPELRSVNLDADWLVRRLGRAAAERTFAWAGSLTGSAASALRGSVLLGAYRLAYLLGPAGPLANPRPLARSAFVVALALLANLAFHLFPHDAPAGSID